ncbi:hypothetical protein Dimus_039617 [Dionaea muscipula]
MRLSVTFSHSLTLSFLSRKMIISEAQQNKNFPLQSKANRIRSSPVGPRKGRVRPVIEYEPALIHISILVVWMGWPGALGPGTSPSLSWVRSVGKNLTLT